MDNLIKTAPCFPLFINKQSADCGISNSSAMLPDAAIVLQPDRYLLFVNPSVFSIFVITYYSRHFVSNQDHIKRLYMPPGLVVRELILELFCSSGTIDGYDYQDDYDWGDGNGEG